MDFMDVNGGALRKTLQAAYTGAFARHHPPGSNRKHKVATLAIPIGTAKGAAPKSPAPAVPTKTKTLPGTIHDVPGANHDDVRDIMDLI